MPEHCTETAEMVRAPSDTAPQSGSDCGPGSVVSEPGVAKAVIVRTSGG
ncbi:hypothetical protein QKW60_10630 [Defluviimonas aestuarii]|nr:hypothetical protein [Defluviimonas aestuarii]MDI3336866.1 hypothetical protein [Defluviimonas aestuarii]